MSGERYGLPGAFVASLRREGEASGINRDLPSLPREGLKRCVNAKPQPFLPAQGPRTHGPPSDRGPGQVPVLRLNS